MRFLLFSLLALILASGAQANHTYSRQAEVNYGVTAVGGHGAHFWRQKALNRTRQVRRLQSAMRSHVRLAGPYGEVAAFKCIHVHEGAWNDPNPPYFGGMQMNLGFQRTYGRVFYEAWGTADKWPPFIQMAVAIEAKLSGRGYYPWPNTARACGLI